VNAPRSIAVLTHTDSGDTHEPLHRLLAEAATAGIEVLLSAEEATKHGLAEGPGVRIDQDPPVDGAELAVVLGGDGTILRALRMFAGRGVPVFALNFGAIGFLATVDRDEVDDGLRRVVTGDFETLSMPALAFDGGGEVHRAASDVSFHRRPSGRVAQLAYMVEDHQLGMVRCDGLVAATPVGSTGYNLANGGPLLAWGVEGFVVSFIAPHSLTARAVVVAPGSALAVMNCSEREAVDVTTDGRTVCELAPRERIEVRFEHDRMLLAQIPGSTFYGRLRDKFGRIAY
jgi:NAD+ kinase